MTILEGITRPRLSFKVELPIWLIVLILSIPFLAYADLVFVGHHGYFEYLFLCAEEIFLLFLGYFIAMQSPRWVRK